MPSLSRTSFWGFKEKVEMNFIYPFREDQIEPLFEDWRAAAEEGLTWRQWINTFRRMDLEKDENCLLKKHPFGYMKRFFKKRGWDHLPVWSGEYYSTYAMEKGNRRVQIIMTKGSTEGKLKIWNSTTGVLEILFPFNTSRNMRDQKMFNLIMKMFDV